MNTIQNNSIHLQHYGLDDRVRTLAHTFEVNPIIARVITQEKNLYRVVCDSGEGRLATGGLRNDDQGRHTTTHRELLRLPGGGLVIDTPGMRELGMWNVSAGFEKSFEDIEALTRNCRFRNCTHTTEPGCAVLAAIALGTLSPDRFGSYKKLLTEAAYSHNPDAYLAKKEQKFKAIAKANRSKKKH